MRQQTAVVPAISQDLLLDSNAALCNSLCGSLVELHEIHYSNIALGKLFLFPLKSQFFLSPLILWLNQRNSMIFFYEAGKSVGQVEKRKRRGKKKENKQIPTEMEKRRRRRKKALVNEDITDFTCNNLGEEPLQVSTSKGKAVNLLITALNGNESAHGYSTKPSRHAHTWKYWKTGAGTSGNAALFRTVFACQP